MDCKWIKKSYDFVVKNYKLFPAKTTEDIGAAKKMVDASISSKLINKNAAPYLDKMVSFSGVVISIEETQLDADNTLAIAHVLDEDEQSYQVMIYKSTGDILEDDSVQFWGVPIGASGFENVSGGYTNAIFVLGSHIEKIQSA
ncbi:hypothetical protein [Cohnella rhizosphaerae]|uniref:Uncharacterized protein n=1 Tax=Cohnella rhizosphaerae TaxID=1457232 RepID=A0A9X4KQZ6_9BACL|nr:hypothetical protein [Cohnella rhizosphaerae]MDG0809280.1 hypothetical protein [Cohnella rhizosphaerae]